MFSEDYLLPNGIGMAFPQKCLTFMSYAGYILDFVVFLWFIEFGYES